MILDHSLGCAECGGACRGLGSCNDTFGMMDLSKPENYRAWVDCVGKENSSNTVFTPVVVSSGSSSQMADSVAQQTIANALKNFGVPVAPVQTFTPAQTAAYSVPTTGGSISPIGTQVVKDIQEKIQPGLNILKTEGVISGVPNWVLLGVGVLGLIGLMGKGD